MRKICVMKFAIVVKSAALDSQGAWSAAQFAAKALNMGHEITRIFFYQQGTMNGSAQNQQPQGQPDCSEHWQALADQGIDLCLCISSAVRRGVMDANEAKRHNKHATLHPAFSIGGLGQLVDAHAKSDRVVTFH
jgi:tRNA 2-thiouridine synthesizing protein D